MNKNLILLLIGLMLLSGCGQKKVVNKDLYYSYIPLGTVISCPDCGNDLYEVVKETTSFCAEMVKAIGEVPQPVNGELPLCPYCNKYLYDEFQEKLVSTKI